MTKPSILISAATASEAKPFKRAFGLSRHHQTRSFSVYSNSLNTIHLIESGIGVANTACAISTLFHMTGMQTHACCLNIGIAGGLHHIGSPFQIHKIHDRATNKRHYPALRPEIKIPSMSIETHYAVCNTYPSHSLVDMESSGFYIAASRFVPNEQTGLLKIVSDNDAQSLKDITKNTVQELIESQMPRIKQYVAAWEEHSLQEAKIHRQPPSYKQLLNQHHFSAYQQNALLKLLNQWQALNTHASLPQEIHRLSNSKAVLLQLKSWIKKTPVIWT